MDVRRAYCSAVDRNVPVIIRPGAQAGPRGHDPADLLCLDYRVRCTGWCCPLMSVDDDAVPVAADPSSRTARRWTRPT